jgi:hypothetical protein
VPSSPSASGHRCTSEDLTIWCVGTDQSVRASRRRGVLRSRFLRSGTSESGHKTDIASATADVRFARAVSLNYIARPDFHRGAVPDSIPLLRPRVIPPCSINRAPNRTAHDGLWQRIITAFDVRCFTLGDDISVYRWFATTSNIVWFICRLRRKDAAS